MMSEWCDSHHWWKDAEFSNPSTAIPRNQIDEVQVDSSFFAYSLIENSQCYSQIPFLQCNNINIVLSTGGGVTNVGNIRGLFTCAELAAANVVAGNNIIFSHWYPNTYCQWNINSFSGGSNDIDQIIFEGLNYFILTNNSFIRKSYISANTINLSGVTLQSIDKYVTTLKAKGGNLFSTLDNVSCVGNRFQYDGSFLVNNSIIEGTGNGKFIFQNNSTNKATLSGSFLFENCINEGKIYGQNTFFISSGGNSCVNNGTVYGDAIFSGLGSVNAGTVSGTTIFISGGINRGTILEPAIFYSGTSNEGTLSKYSLFDYATNNGPLLSGSKFTFSTNNYSIGDGSGNFLFENNSHNRKSIGTSGVISFINGSNNWAALSAPSATVIFDLASFNRGGPIQGIATFGSECANVIGGILVTGIFNSNSINSGMILSLGVFNDSSINMWDATNAIFNSRSANSGRIIESGRFEDSSRNGAIVKNGYFYGRSAHASGATAQISAIFCNQARNVSGSKINQLAEFGQSSINYGGDTDTNASFNFFENAINYGYINNEKVLFSGSSINRNYGKKIHFYNSSINDTTGSGYEAAFLNSSINNGYISYTGHFFNTSQNGKLGVLNTGIFHDFAINNGSMRRPLVSGLEALTSGYRKIDILDSGINNVSLYNVEFNVKTSGINRGNLQWVFDPLIIFTTSGIYNTGTTPYSIVETGTFQSSYISAIIPSITFDDSSINRGTIVGYKEIKFLNKSSNYGNIRTYPPIETNTPCVTFKGSGKVFDIPPSAIFCKNYGIIQNGATFTSGINFSSIGSGDFTESSNSGSAESARFNKSRNFGSINKIGVFNDSSNFGIINQSGFFYNSINMGPVYSGYFNKSSNSGSLDIGEFVDQSKNSGNILQSGSFLNSYNVNQFIPLPLATFAGASNNSGIVALGYYYGSSTNSNTGLVNEFYDSSKNKGTVFRQAMFSGSSTNSGLVVNTSYFRGNSSNQNSGLGLLFFYDSAKNESLLSGIVSFEAGINNGVIVGDRPISFFSGSINNNLIIGDTTFSLDCINNGYLKGKGIFLSNSLNNGTVSGDTSFSSGCKNANIVMSGHAIFLSGSANDKNVFGTSEFYNSKNNSFVSDESKFYDSINFGNAQTYGLFYGTGYNAGSVVTGIFNNRSSNNGVATVGLFYNESKNSLTVNSGAFYNASYNQSSVTNASLYDSAINQGTINNGYFYNQSFNSGTVSVGYFLFGGTNYGTISSNASFNNAFSKSGNIGGNAIFTNNSYCEKTSINGSATFDGTSCYDKNTTSINGTITKSQDCNP